MNRSIKSTLLLFALIFCLTFAASVLSACNAATEDKLYAFVQSYSYDAETDTVTALIKLNYDTETDIVGRSERTISRDGFYNEYSYSYKFNSDIWDKIKVDAALSDELSQTLTDAGVDSVYNVNIQYVYMTEYKSVTANGKYSETGKVRSYVWTFSDGDEVEMNLYQTVENRAAWYGLTVGIVVIVVVVITVTVAFKKNKEKQNASDTNEG
ncbi:MAG: hypothetical protein ACI4MT_03795 [Christensenellales bacterium]